MIRGKKVLITGGLGFVGSNLAIELVSNFDCDVTIIDNKINSNENSIRSIRSKVEFLEISVLDDKIYEILPRFDYIFHMACIQIAASSNQPFLDLDVNAVSTLKILEYLRKNLNRTALKRFIYTSSGSVYGSSTRLPLKEDSVVRPLSNYAATKLLGENYTLVYGKKYNIPVSALRYSNVYGFGQTPKNPYCGVLGKFVHSACTGNPLTIIGDGEQTRDYTFISDAISATIKIAESPYSIFDVFNIGTSTEVSVNQLASYMKQRFPEVELVYIPERDIDNIRRRSIDIEKIHQRLRWSPSVNIEKGITLTIDWYKKFLSELVDNEE